MLSAFDEALKSAPAWLLNAYACVSCAQIVVAAIFAGLLIVTSPKKETK